ncbi:hypothetical protein D3C72_2229610 [compost metagenome]
MAACEPIRPPTNWPTAMMPARAQTTWPPAARTTMPTTLLIRFSALVWAVARVSPMPSSMTRLSAKKDPVPGPKKPS